MMYKVQILPARIFHKKWLAKVPPRNKILGAIQEPLTKKSGILFVTPYGKYAMMVNGENVPVSQIDVFQAHYLADKEAADMLKTIPEGMIPIVDSRGNLVSHARDHDHACQVLRKYLHYGNGLHPAAKIRVSEQKDGYSITVPGKVFSWKISFK